MSSLHDKEVIADGNAILTIEFNSSYWAGTKWSITKKCNECHLAVFIPHGEDKDNCLNIVESRFAEMHKCTASSAGVSSAVQEVQTSETDAIL